MSGRKGLGMRGVKGEARTRMKGGLSEGWPLLTSRDRRRERNSCSEMSGPHGEMTRTCCRWAWLKTSLAGRDFTSKEAEQRRRGERVGWAKGEGQGGSA